jgi:hypothetical protein
MTGKVARERNQNDIAAGSFTPLHGAESRQASEREKENGR